MIRPHEGVIAANCFEMHPLEEERVMEDGEEAEGEYMDASAFADGPLTKFVESCSFEEAVKLHGLVMRAAANASNMSSLQFSPGTPREPLLAAIATVRRA